MRFEAIKCISKSYRPTVPVVYIARILGFLLNGDDRLEECEIWLKAHGAILSLDNSGELQIDTKVTISLSLSLSLSGQYNTYQYVCKLVFCGLLLS
jgi:hypothetical protein